MKRMDQCKYCAYWVMSPEDKLWGICRRYPPVLVYKPSDERGQEIFDWRQPETYHATECGEFIGLAEYYNG